MSVQGERALLKRIAGGDRIAFDSLFYSYWEDVYHYVIKVLNDEDSTADVVQETFLALWEQRQQLGYVVSVSGYIFSIARNQAFTHIRKLKYAATLRESLLNHLNDHEQSSEETYITAELQRLIADEIGQLPEKMREIFILSRESGLSYKEIGAELGISENTVKKQISNSLKRLRLKLSSGLLILFLVLFL